MKFQRSSVKYEKEANAALVNIFYYASALPPHSKKLHLDHLVDFDGRLADIILSNKY